MRRFFSYLLALGLAVAASDFAADAADDEGAEAAQALSVVERWSTDAAQVFDASEIALDDLLWTARLVVVFADSARDPSFQTQLELLLADIDALGERDVLIATDTEPAEPSPLRLKLRPRGFMLALIGKDGVVYLRKPLPWNVRELRRSIDKIPLRKREIRDRRGS